VDVATESPLRVALEAGVTELSLTAPERAIDQLLAFLRLLIQWNRAFNLTAVRDPSDMVTRHLLDSLSLVPHIEGQRFLDVGTGAGLPGIPLAIWFPDKQFELLDSNGKKMRFLFKVCHELGLANVRLHQIRVEHHQDLDRFDAILSRAYASLNDMVSSTHHLLRDSGRFYAMKAELSEQERLALPSAYTIESITRLNVPNLDAERQLVSLRCR